jgi:signal transduction histidine kinase
MFFNSLSGRFLIMSVIFVMLAEVLIFVPSVARFREEYLLGKIEKAQIASLSVLASERGGIGPELAGELLRNAGVFNVVLRRDSTRQLILSSPIEGQVTTFVDLRGISALELIKGAIMQLAMPADGVIRVIGEPIHSGGTEIEVVMPQAPLKEAIIEYGLNILKLSLVISIISAVFLYLAVRLFMVGPIKRTVGAMQAYAAAPQDVRRIIQPSSKITELRTTEEALKDLQTQLTGSLKQKERLAQLGGAVAKISHDLRNILTTATLLADRMEMSEDPAVKRTAPKLVNSLSRAVNLCEGTLAFGRAEEPAPTLSMHPLAQLVDEVLDGEELAADGTIRFDAAVPSQMFVRCDAEQIHRVLGNLVRNARQAIAATGQEGTIIIRAEEDEIFWRLYVCDTGPGLPPKAKENLFTAFEGGVRKGGTGLGLVIASELIKGHGGSLDLLKTDADGTDFVITLPKAAVVELETAAQ